MEWELRRADRIGSGRGRKTFFEKPLTSLVKPPKVKGSLNYLLWNDYNEQPNIRRSIQSDPRSPSPDQHGLQKGPSTQREQSPDGGG